VIKLAESKTSGTGLSKNTAAALSYVLGPITGIVFLILEKDPYVRFHSMQSIVVFTLFWFLLPWALGLTIILAILVPLIWIASFILWLVLVYKAWQGQEWEVPVLGKLAKQLLNKA
jgi:uncharacterized membrane protein